MNPLCVLESNVGIVSDARERRVQFIGIDVQPTSHRFTSLVIDQRVVDAPIASAWDHFNLLSQYAYDT